MFIQFDENGGWEAIAASALRACAFYSSGMETEKKNPAFPSVQLLLLLDCDLLVISYIKPFFFSVLIYVIRTGDSLIWVVLEF